MLETPLQQKNKENKEIFLVEFDYPVLCSYVIIKNQWSPFLMIQKHRPNIPRCVYESAWYFLIFSIKNCPIFRIIIVHDVFQFDTANTIFLLTDLSFEKWNSLIKVSRVFQFLTWWYAIKEPVHIFFKFNHWVIIVIFLLYTIWFLEWRMLRNLPGIISGDLIKIWEINGLYN